MNQETDQRLLAALSGMQRSGPKNLSRYVEAPNPDFEKVSEAEVRKVIQDLVRADEACQSADLFASLLRKWDNTKDNEDGGWAKKTPRNTVERRALIHGLLGLSGELAAQVDGKVPFLRLEEPLIITKNPGAWTRPVPANGDSYYWNLYQKYLRERKGLGDEAILNLDNSIKEILGCLSQPDSPAAYSSRGLVVGYVQSGKTSNFTGLIARAADAGYRLIIILAGTWNILRNQTQRRIDKELLGQQLVEHDEAYSPRPNDWDKFVLHEFHPRERGVFSWDRVTGPARDYSRMGPATNNLDYVKFAEAREIFHLENLKKMNVKLLVIKKHSKIIANLTKDLGRTNKLVLNVPALVIDDESDQAGLNTVKPELSKIEELERTKTNGAIVKLLEKLPRAQYIGYTATPYANALVNPDDEADLFPKDFIVSLHRPTGYMGISDFFDPERTYEDLDPNDFSQNEIAFIRRVENTGAADDADLEKALLLFVLSGALKLFRNDRHKGCVKTDHHTMLVHTSSATKDHEKMAKRIATLWLSLGLNSPKGAERLRREWEQDILPVTKHHGKGLPLPAQFAELEPFLGQAITNLTMGSSHTLILNSDKKDAPDFNAAPVWKIIVGGNKLSRGYTVEGLTISYYRRVTKTADTLMQMGRWFGFREGYRDLVRVFVGVQEGKRNPVNLVESFKATCLMEERFREEIRRYVREEGRTRITPRDIPPLIEITGDLAPTAKNKMFNAEITRKNFGGQWSQPTLVAAAEPGIRHNQQLLVRLLSRSRRVVDNEVLGGTRSDGKTDRIPCHGFEATQKDVIDFLEGYRWVEGKFAEGKRPSSIQLQIEFLRREKHGIDSWLVLLPQTVKGESHGPKFTILKGLETNVRERNWVEEGEGARRLQQVGEPAHRRLAKWMCKIKTTKGCYLESPLRKEQQNLQDSHRGVLLVYAVRPSDAKGPAVIGFEMLYPENNLPKTIGFSVRDPRKADDIIISA